MTIETSSKAIRQHCLDLRTQVSSERQIAASAAVCARIEALQHYQSAKHVALYYAVKGEINLNALPRLPGQIHYFPVMNTDRTLSFFPTDSNTLFLKNRFGIFEPEVPHEHAIMPEQLDIIFLPVVAFDESGTRVGMGGGYYDRTLAHHSTSLLAGVAYEFQCQPYIPRQAWDVPLNVIITECTTYWSKP